jgi:uncharacterized oxidoreductase
VIACGRNAPRLRVARRRLPGLEIRACDVSAARSRASLVRWLGSGFPGLNLLVNNAGIQRPVDFLRGRRDLADADQEIATNLAAVVHLSALLIPQLRRQKRAAIVNVSSGLAFTPLAAVPVYCATKAAVHSLSLSLRHQLRRTSVRVFEIAPPIVRTGLSGGRKRPDDGPYTLSAREVAAGVLGALQRNDYEVALGAASRLHDQREALFQDINQ